MNFCVYSNIYKNIQLQGTSFLKKSKKKNHSLKIVGHALNQTRGSQTSEYFKKKLKCFNIDKRNSYGSILLNA